MRVATVLGLYRPSLFFQNMQSSNGPCLQFFSGRELKAGGWGKGKREANVEQWNAPCVEHSHRHVSLPSPSQYSHTPCRMYVAHAQASDGDTGQQLLAQALAAEQGRAAKRGQVGGGWGSTEPRWHVI